MKKNKKNISTINNQDLPGVSGGATRFGKRFKIIEKLKKRWPTRPSPWTDLPSNPIGPVVAYGVVQPVPLDGLPSIGSPSKPSK